MGSFFWIIAAVVVGAYLSGASSQGTWNPFKWDWKSGKLWGNLAIGGLAGGVAAVAGPALAGAIAPALTASGVSIAGGALIGATSGLIGGAIQGFGGTLVNGGNIGSAFKAAAIGGGAGALAGVAMGAAFSAVQLGIHNAKVNTAIARGVKNPGVKLNYWTGKPVQPGRSAWSFSNAKPNYVKPKPVIEIGRLSEGHFQDMGTLKDSYVQDGFKTYRRSSTPDDLIDNVKEFSLKKAYIGNIQMSESTFNNLKADFQVFKTGDIPGGFTFKFPDGKWVPFTILLQKGVS